MSLADSLFFWVLLGNPASAAAAPTLGVKAGGGWSQGAPYPLLETSFKVKEDAGVRLEFLCLARFSGIKDYPVRDEEQVVDVIHRESQFRIWALGVSWGRALEPWAFGVQALGALADLSDKFWSDSGVMFQPVFVEGTAKALGGAAGLSWTQGEREAGVWARYWKELGGSRTQSEPNDFVWRETIVPWAPAAGLGPELGVRLKKGSLAAEGLILSWKWRPGLVGSWEGERFGLSLGWVQKPLAFLWVRWGERGVGFEARAGHWGSFKAQALLTYNIP